MFLISDFFLPFFFFGAFSSVADVEQNELLIYWLASEIL